VTRSNVTSQKTQKKDFNSRAFCSDLTLPPPCDTAGGSQTRAPQNLVEKNAWLGRVKQAECRSHDEAFRYILAALLFLGAGVKLKAGGYQYHATA